MATERRFSEAEAEAILRRALASQRTEGLTRDELVDAARGVGLDESALDAAIEAQSRVATDAALRSAWARARRRALLVHAALFVVVNALLFAVDMATPPDDPWFHWPLIVWAVALAADVVSARRGPSEEALAEMREEERVRSGAGVRVAPERAVEATERDEVVGRRGEDVARR